MDRVKNKTAFILSGIITLLAAVASGGGLFMKNLYQDNAFVKMAWYTNDLVTLFVVVPSLIIAMFLARKGDFRWFLILLGLLGYVFYNFAFYLFGAAFNVFFLVYTSLLSLSAGTIILFLSQSSLSDLASNFSDKTPVKWISLYLFLIAFMLFMVELSMIVPFLTSSIIPETITLTGNGTSIVFALDFSIVIPVSLIAAILLWQRRSWGFILGVMMLVKGFTYGLVLSVGTASLAYSAVYGKWDPLMPLYVALAIGGLLCCWLLLKNFNPIKIQKPKSSLAEKFNVFEDMYWAWSYSIYVAFALIIWIQVETIFVQGVGWLQTFYLLYALPIILVALLPQIRTIYKK